jgi:hypothetical protein
MIIVLIDLCLHHHRIIEADDDDEKLKVRKMSDVFKVRHLHTTVTYDSCRHGLYKQLQ